MRISDWSSDVCSSDLHPSRLDRDLGRKRWGDEGYAREELVAEVGAAFLCADLGVAPEVRADHAAYVASWLQVLKDDKRAIFQAAAHAQRAVDYLHGLQPGTQGADAARQSAARSEEHTSELQALMRISYAVFCF